MARNILILFLILFLSSCATVTPQTQKPTDNWVIRGKIGIQSPQENGSASVVWQQQEDNYHIRLFGPLGMGAVELNGQPNHVSFTNNKGEVFQATSADLLLQQNIGWQIPVSNLVYWVRGIPAPKYKSQKIYDEQHQLKTLNQQGWEINYLRYQNGLPSLIALNRHDIQLRLAIYSWKII